MKYIYKIFFLFLMVIGFTSCDENENFEILPAPESFEIVTPSNGTVIVLDTTNLSNNGLFLSWKSTGSSSGATYTIEVAETGTDFVTPIVLGTTDSVNFSMTVGELNTFLLDVLEINPNKATSLDFRVSGNGQVTQTSAVVFTPYQLEYSELFLVGSFTGGDPATSLAMTNIDYNVFEITVDLADGDTFKFIPTNTSMDGDLGEDPNNPGNLTYKGEQDISGYPAGKYKIIVDLNTLTFTIEAVTAPDNLFLVGQYNGWNAGTAKQFYNNGDGVFSVVQSLQAGGEGFKFLQALGSWDGDWGESKTDPRVLVQDDEQNLIVDTAGLYVIVVNFNTLTIKTALIDNMYMVGDHNGWDNGSAPQLSSNGNGIFSIIQSFEAGNGFKFLPTLGSWDGDWGESKVSTGILEQDDEQNLTAANDGLYVVAVNFNTLSFTVSSVSDIPTSLYLVGSFNGWSNDAGSPQFTETSAGIFEITQALSAGDEFKFVTAAGSWDGDWGENKTSSNVLEQNDEQNITVADAGTYVITVNFNDGTISVN